METRLIICFVMYTPWSKLCLLRLQRRVQLFYVIALPIIENGYPTSTCLLFSRVNYPSSSYCSSKNVVYRPFIILLPNWGILQLVDITLKIRCPRGNTILQVWSDHHRVYSGTITLLVPATSLLLMLVQITFASFGRQVTSLAQVAFTVN